MDFVAGVMVFPGGGVDDRDRNADVAWFGPEPAWWAERLRRRTGPGRGVGVRRGARDVRRVRRAVRRARRRPRRHRRRRIDLPRIAAGAGGPFTVVRGVPAPREPGAARGSAAAVGELGDAQGRAHPPLRHLLLRGRTARRPARRRREHRNRYGRLDHASGGPRRFRRSRTFLLPPTWTQLDSLAGRTVAEVLAVERQIVPVEPHLAAKNGNWEIEFFDSDRYNSARKHRAPDGYGPDTPLA